MRLARWSVAVVAALVAALTAPGWAVVTAVVVWLAVDARQCQLEGRRRRRAALRNQERRQSACP